MEKKITREDPRYVMKFMSVEEARELGCNFVALMGDDLISGWKGDNELAFLEAIEDELRNSSHCSEELIEEYMSTLEITDV